MIAGTSYANLASYKDPVAVQVPRAYVFNVRALFNHDSKDIEGCVQTWASWLPSGGLLCLIVLAADHYDQTKIHGGYDSDGLCAKVKRRFMGSEDVNTLFTYVGWKKLLDKNGLAIVDKRMEIFGPLEGTDSDSSPQYCTTTRKV
ncbi:S-adenosyl-L-methionine-dependent methyltransferase [Penicillium freii]|nr:S-adenosyl-L-methionine-dependent methyltransferase [Penicillium freii]